MKKNKRCKILEMNKINSKTKKYLYLHKFFFGILYMFFHYKNYFNSNFHKQTVNIIIIYINYKVALLDKKIYLCEKKIEKIYNLFSNNFSRIIIP